MTRLATMTYALLLACFMAFVAAPAAHAQLLDGVGDAVGDVVGGGSGGDDGGSSTDPGGSLVGGIEDILDDDGENSSTGSNGGDEEPSDDGGLVGGVVDTVDKTVNGDKDPVKEIVDGGSATLDDATGGYFGGITGTVEKTLDGPEKVVKKNKSENNQARKTTTGKTSSRDADIFGRKFLAALAMDQKRRVADATAVRAVAEAVEEPADSVVQQIGRVAAEAAEQMAFPVILLLMVGAFLVGQNRVDRRDPKLALAPVDLDADLLSFT